LGRGSGAERSPVIGVGPRGVVIDLVASRSRVRGRAIRVPWAAVWAPNVPRLLRAAAWTGPRADCGCVAGVSGTLGRGLGAQRFRTIGRAAGVAAERSRADRGPVSVPQLPGHSGRAARRRHRPAREPITAASPAYPGTLGRGSGAERSPLLRAAPWTGPRTNHGCGAIDVTRL